jgi:hypothetical protein
VIGADVIALAASATALSRLCRISLRLDRDGRESEEQTRWRDFEQAFRRQVSETSGEREP